MKTQQIKLEKKLQEEGWLIAERSSAYDWWADEVWTVESVWRPVGRQLWITFLVDPQHDGTRRPGERVWAVGVTESLPVGRQQVEPTAVPIRNTWSSSLDKLMTLMGRLRDKAIGQKSELIIAAVLLDERSPGRLTRHWSGKPVEPLDGLSSPCLPPAIW